MELRDQFMGFPHVEKRGPMGPIFHELFSKARFDLLVLMQAPDLDDPFFVKDAEAGTVGEFLSSHGQVIGSGNPLLWRFSDEGAIYRFNESETVLGGVGDVLYVKTRKGVDYSVLGKEYFEKWSLEDLFSARTARAMFWKDGSTYRNTL
jgi:hypothetical protein